MKRYLLLTVVPFLLLFSSCNEVRYILPDDLSDPAHVWYVASGDKTKDRQQFHAYMLICDELWTPILEDQFVQCMQDPKRTESSCGVGYFKILLIWTCAAGLVDYHPGARRYEFFDPNEI